MREPKMHITLTKKKFKAMSKRQISKLLRRGFAITVDLKSK
jgi:hypothetical protein